MTDEQKQRVEELRRQGVGYKLIAKEMDVSRSCIRQYCKKHGLAGYGKCIAAMARDENKP